MNIAIINAKDLFKYIIKILIIISIILFLIEGIKNINSFLQGKTIKQTIEQTTPRVNEYSFLECLDLSMSLMSYTKIENKNEKLLTTNKILTMGSGILDESIIKNTDLIINENELTIDDAEELSNQTAVLPNNVTTQSVEENNIAPRVTTSYGTVQINNQSDYEITEDTLNPNIEITNKKDILIYHTHTCESYTSSPRI